MLLFVSLVGVDLGDRVVDKASVVDGGTVVAGAAGLTDVDGAAGTVTVDEPTL